MTTVSLPQSLPAAMPGFHHYKGQKYLRISSLVSAARCLRKFFYGFGCDMESINPAPALLFGESMHAALPLVLTKGVQSAFVEFTRLWDQSLNDDKRNPSRAQAMLENFALSHESGKSIYNIVKPPPSHLKFFDRVSEYELPWAIDIGIGIPLVGRIDAIATHRDTGENWLVEWKTTSELSGRFFSSFEISAQACGYLLAARTNGLNPRGVFVEGLRVSHVNSETMLQPFQYGDHLLEDFLTWARYIGGQILACEKAQNFPKDLSACTPYGQFGQPGYKCNFHILCETPDWTMLKPMFGVSKGRPYDVEIGD